MEVYLDNSATTKVFPEVAQLMTKIMCEDYGNPSSMHRKGVEAEQYIRYAKETLARILKVSEKEIFFTSGGTESDNMALIGCAMANSRRGRHLITTQIEHPAILQTFAYLENSGFCVTYLPVDKQGRIRLEDLKRAICSDTILVSIMHTNNEIGSLQPIAEAGALIKKINPGTLFHVDAVQGFGKIDLKNTGADLISVSAHKIHGPKGMGALYVKKGINLPAYLVGGGQERHMRSGTENVPGIVGFDTACQIAIPNLKSRTEQMSKVRNYLLAGIEDQIKDIKVNSPVDGAASVLNISFLGTRGEVLLHTLEQDNIFVSTGSACSSNKKGQSHVLAAMGLKDKEIEGAIRFSFSEANTIEEMDYVLDKVNAAVTRFRRLGSFR